MVAFCQRAAMPGRIALVHPNSRRSCSPSRDGDGLAHGHREHWDHSACPCPIPLRAIGTHPGWQGHGIAAVSRRGGWPMRYLGWLIGLLALAVGAAAAAQTVGGGVAPPCERACLTAHIDR